MYSAFKSNLTAAGGSPVLISKSTGRQVAFMDAPIQRPSRTQKVAEKLTVPSGTEIVDLSDKGGRRVGVERRRYSYTCYIPERRSGEDRRSGGDRRSADRPHPIPAIEASQSSDFRNNAASR